MKRSYPISRKGRANRAERGFTLIEVLLALVVSVMVMTACGMLYYSIALAWIDHRQGDVELQHEHSIFAFLEQEWVIQPNLPSQLPGIVDGSLSWQSLPGASAYDPVYLSWLTPEPPAFLMTGRWTDHTVTRMYLRFDTREGVSLIWHPDDAKVERMGFTNYRVEDHLYRFPLALDWISLSYAYWDAEQKRWEIEPHLRNYDPGERGVPDALIFEVEGRELTRRTLYLNQELSLNPEESS